jgi:hypothetical protein
MTHLEVVAVGHNGLIRLLEFYFVYDPYVMDDTPDLQSGTRSSSIVSKRRQKVMQERVESGTDPSQPDARNGIYLAATFLDAPVERAHATLSSAPVDT